MKCPFCHGTRVYLLQRSGILWILAIFFIAPYYCSYCYHHFYRFKLPNWQNFASNASCWLQRRILVIRYFPSWAGPVRNEDWD